MSNDVPTGRRRMLVTAALLTVASAPLWWLTVGGLPVFAIILQPWSVPILFNGMVPAWLPSGAGLSVEFFLASSLSLVVSFIAYAGILLGVSKLWRLSTRAIARVGIALGCVSGYVILMAVCFTLAIADLPTIPAPQRVAQLLDREFGIEATTAIANPRYTYFGFGDWSDFARFSLPGQSIDVHLKEAGYEPVELSGLRPEARMRWQEKLENGPYWWNPSSTGRYFSKRSGRTVACLILNDENALVYLRRDHF